MRHSKSYKVVRIPFPSYTAGSIYQTSSLTSFAMAPHRVLLLMKALGRGGAEQIILHSAAYTNKTRFQYHVAYLLPWRDAFVGDLAALGYQVHCLQGALGVGWIARLRRLVRDCHIEIIHCHTPYVAAGARIALCRSRPIIVQTEHNSWRRYHKATYWANLLTYPRTDHVFAVSRAVLDAIEYPSLLRFLPMPPVEVLIHGIHLASVRHFERPQEVRSELGISESDFVIGTIANMKPQKGLEYLIKSVALLHPSLNVRLVIVGDGQLNESLKSLSSSLELGNRVTFAGYRPDAVRIATAFDVFVLSSTIEGLPIALIEALALGKPVIVTNVGGMPEVIQNRVEGFVVPSRNPAALCNAIVELMRNPALRLRMGEAARLRSYEFDIRRSVERTEEVYGQLLENSGRS